MSKTLLFILFCIAINVQSFSQNLENKSDILEEKLLHVKTDTARIMVLIELSANSRFFDIDKSRDYLEQAFELGQTCGSRYHLAKVVLEKGAMHINDGEYQKGILIAEKAFKILDADTVYVTNNDKRTSQLLGKIYNVLGTGHDYFSEYNKAVKYYLKALDLCEKVGDLDGLGVTYNNLGISYLYMEDLDKSESCFTESYKIYMTSGDTTIASNANMNIGIIYYYRKNYETAIAYFRESLVLMKSIGDLRNMSHCITNIGEVYSEMGLYDSALVYSAQGIALDEVLEDIEGLSTDYRARGTIFLSRGDLDSAAFYHEKALVSARELGRKIGITQSLETLSKIEKQRGNYKRAYEYHVEYALYNDSLMQESNSTELGKIEAQADFDNKILKEKEANKRKLEVEEAKRSRQTIITYFTIGVLVVILFFVYFLFKSLRKIKVQKEFVQKAKAEVEEKNTEMTDSIKYAQRIQLALLKEDDDEIAVLPNHFILFKPKDIVSGDFYWSYHIDDYWYIAAADCTGHGVPGAMLTMLGTAYLNEICAGGVVHSPAEILDKLKLKITKELSQKGLKGESKDGMDMSLLRMNLKTREVQWAGANNPLYVISNGELSETKADKQPIGFSDNVKPFVNHTVDLNEGDSVYLFTDGYADQFGGPKGKKFKYSSFKKLLLETDPKDAIQQHDTLDETIESWKGSLEQLDDICIIGIRF